MSIDDIEEMVREIPVVDRGPKGEQKDHREELLKIEEMVREFTRT